MPTRERVRTTEEALNLAQIYLKEGVVGKKSYSDALHIALATVEKSTAIVSWNFKHIVRYDKSSQHGSSWT